MLPFLDPFASPTPAWLRRLTPAAIQQGPGALLQRLTEKALVYPGSDLDGSPVRQLNGVLHSFIFMDYGTDPQVLKAEMTQERRHGTGFAHHRLLGLSEFDPLPFLKDVPDQFRCPAAGQWAQQRPWGIWGVYEDTRAGREGERFSLLFFGTEAHEVMAALFPRRAPTALVIQEHGFGGNCRQSHADAVLELAQQWESLPELLIMGENTWNRPWPERLVQVGSDVASESWHRNRRTFSILLPDMDPGLSPGTASRAQAMAAFPDAARKLPDGFRGVRGRLGRVFDIPCRPAAENEA